MGKGKKKKSSWYDVRWDEEKGCFVIDPTIPSLRSISKSLKKRKKSFNKWMKFNFMVKMMSEIPMEFWSNPADPIKSARDWLKKGKK